MICFRSLKAFRYVNYSLRVYGKYPANQVDILDPLDGRNHGLGGDSSDGTTDETDKYLPGRKPYVGGSRLHHQ